METDTKEWVTVKRGRNGGTTVTVTVKQGSHSASWSAVTYLNTIPDVVTECRKYATEALSQIGAAA